MSRSPLSPKSGPLNRLLPIQLKGGFVIEHLSDECSKCGSVIEVDRWMAEISWLGAAALVLNMNATCPSCGAPKHVHARFRGKPDGTAEIDCDQGDGRGWTAHDAFPASRWRTMIWSIKQGLGFRS